jgi:hypothetical protein
MNILTKEKLLEQIATIPGRTHEQRKEIVEHVAFFVKCFVLRGPGEVSFSDNSIVQTAYVKRILGRD